LKNTLAFLLLLAAATAAPAADDAAVTRCRAVADAAARLACYDALPLATSAKPAAQRDFGLPQPAPTTEGQAIESSIAGRFEGWEPNQQIALANGQVWRVVDGSSAFVILSSPKVRVERGALGAFYLVVDGLNKTARVRRVR
jgi:hypothetical protein